MSKKPYATGAPTRRRWWLAALAIAFAVLLFFRVTDESVDRYVILDILDHPPGTATPYVPKKRRYPPFYLVHTEEHELYAIVRLAPESNCLVVWDEDMELFVDPCDDSRYGWDGVHTLDQTITLSHLFIEDTDEEHVFIDMGRRFNPLQDDA